MAVENILFDADGVLQDASAHWQTALKSILQLDDDTQAAAVLNDVLDAESGVLELPTGFRERLEALLANWDRAAQVSETLNALHAIDVYADVMATVQALRSAGVRCHVASNQQALRAKHMSEVLNYRNLFDSEFYSCFLGAAKPKLEFFDKVLAKLGCNPRAVLFLDDRLENVEAAKRAGLSAAVVFGADGAASLQRQLASFGVLVRSASRTA